MSFAFPPSQIIGAMRVSKTAKFLHRFGHEVRVIAGLNQPYAMGANLEIPAEHVSYTPWLDVDVPYQRTLSMLQAARRSLRGKTRAPDGAAGLESQWQRLHGTGDDAKNSRTLSERVRFAYQDLVHVPDSSIGWYRSAVREGHRVIKEFQPDVIFASASPTTCLLVARKLSLETGIPWVAELRDLWADNHYNNSSRIRHSIDQWLERRTLSSAAAVVTVSEPLAESLRAKYTAPVSIVLNGFDVDDIDDNALTLSGISNRKVDAAARAQLELLHCGTVLAQRDPTPLFDAIKLMGADGRDVIVRFLGTMSVEMRNHLQAIAASRGVAEQLQFVARVPHAEAVRLQRETDVLLLLTWNNPLERGVYTGKLFEYIGAKRPILSVGLADGVAADLIRHRKFGFASDSPEKIAKQLLAWLAEKRTQGLLPSPKSDDVQEFTREAQTRVLERVLQDAVARTPTHRSKA
ncbi:MAG: glycosyltransferase [Gemmatimonadaceae bacterium]